MMPKAMKKGGEIVKPALRPEQCPCCWADLEHGIIVNEHEPDCELLAAKTRIGELEQALREVAECAGCKQCFAKVAALQEQLRQWNLDAAEARNVDEELAYTKRHPYKQHDSRVLRNSVTDDAGSPGCNEEWLREPGQGSKP